MKFSNRAAAAVFGGLVVCVFGDLLLRGDGVVASHRVGDGIRYFVFLREFGYAELARGNLALWNPHLFSGTPFVGSFQAAMLYPPNLIYLLLPLPVAFNCEIALHVALLGGGAFVWCRARGHAPAGALVAASIAAFGATASLRVLAGALSVLDTFAWVPWLLVGIDALARRPGARAVAGTAFAAAMLLLAGHPPTALMAGVVCGAYALLALRRSPRRLHSVAAGAAAGLLATAAAAAQLALGFEAARESIRQAGTPFEFATSYSFPPENLLTLAVPYLFGRAETLTLSYFGRWFYWDDSAFVGIAALLAAALGAGQRRARPALAAFVALCALALGRYTPLYSALYAAVPGFDLLRAPGKFMFFATLFLAFAAGAGIDRLLAGGVGTATRRGAAIACASAGLAALGLALWIAREPSALAALAAWNDQRSIDAQAIGRWAPIAAASLRVAGATALGLAALVALAARRWAGAAIAAVCLLELVAFARANRGGIAWDFGIAPREQTAELFRRAGDRRVLQVRYSTVFALAPRGYSVWGYDPVVLDRYARFVARSQGLTVAQMNNVGGEPPRRYDPLLRLVRAHYVVGGARMVAAPSGRARMLPLRVGEFPGELDRFELIGRYRVETDPDATLDALQAEDFDPRALVWLEAEPDPRPAGRAVDGRVAVLEESTDGMLLEVDVDAPAILLVTDAWARGWRAAAEPGSVQQRYRVAPADLVLRAIALEAGHHRLRLEYAPASYRVGAVASVAAGLAWLGVCAAALRRGAAR